MMHFALHAQYGHALTHKNPAPGLCQFTLLAEPFLLIKTILSLCVLNAHGKEKMIFKKYINFINFTPK